MPDGDSTRAKSLKAKNSTKFACSLGKSDPSSFTISKVNSRGSKTTFNFLDDETRQLVKAIHIDLDFISKISSDIDIYMRAFNKGWNLAETLFHICIRILLIWKVENFGSKTMKLLSNLKNFLRIQQSLTQLNPRFRWTIV